MLIALVIFKWELPCVRIVHVMSKGLARRACCAGEMVLLQQYFPLKKKIRALFLIGYEAKVK